MTRLVDIYFCIRATGNMMHPKRRRRIRRSLRLLNNYWKLFEKPLCDANSRGRVSWPRMKARFGKHKTLLQHEKNMELGKTVA